MKLRRKLLRKTVRKSKNEKADTTIFTKRMNFLAAEFFLNELKNSKQPGDPGLSIPCRRTIPNDIFPVNCEPGYLLNVIKTDY